MRTVAAVLAALCVCLAPRGARADDGAAKAHLYAGLQGLILAGMHRDVAGSQRGIAGGALLQLGLQGKRVGFRFEGIPPVSLPQGASSAYGQATPQLSLINGAIRFSLDRAAHVWAGAGMTIINQRTPLPNLSQVVTSRLAGARFELFSAPPCVVLISWNSRSARHPNFSAAIATHTA